MDGTAPPELVSLLSASSYPVPEPPHGLRFQGDGPSISEPITVSGSTPGTRPTNQAMMGPAAVNLNNPAGGSSTTPGTPSKRRGRPRKPLGENVAMTYEERRRMQVLIAQRAYRSRKEVTLLNYQDRIVKLEGIVRNMNSLVQSFGEQQLARAESDALVSPAELASSLRNTMEACASMARGADQDTLEDDDSHSQSHIHRGGDPSSSSLPIQEEACAPAPPTNSAKQSRTTPTRSSSPGRFLKDLMVLQSSPSGVPSFDSVSAAVVPVQLSAFIEHLRVACVYHAYTALSNPGIAFESIRNKFRFLLSLMNRERLTSYFKAALEARVNQSGLRKEWEGIPFFGVGGAGSHYAQNRAPSSSGDGEEERTQSPWPLVKEPLSKLPTQAREDMDGDWFDVRDLEGFLRERQVRLTAYSSKVHQHRTVMGGVDVASLLQVLVSSCICLGRSPGWRRRDVEDAVRKAAES